MMRTNGKGRYAGALTTPLGSVGAALLATVLLLQGLGVAGIAQLTALPGLSLLSSSGPLGGLAPLSDEYVRRVLGLPPLTQPPALTTSQQPSFVSTVSAGSGPTAGRPVTLAHAFDNDSFGSARTIPSVPYTATTDTSGQTRESGEPTSCAPVGGTAWYRYTAPTDQALFADTFGTKYADSLGVFTGDSIRNLTQVGCNSSTGGAAQTGFLARRGVSYWFQVAGTLAGGSLAFHLVPVGRTDAVSTHGRTAFALSGDSRLAAFVGVPQSAGGGAQNCAASTNGTATAATVYCNALYIAELSTGRVRLLVSAHPEAGRDTLRVEASILDLSMSGDGRYVSFDSNDSHLVSNDTNLEFDIFVADTVTGRVERVSVASDGSQTTIDPTSNSNTSQGATGVGNAFGSFAATISGNGRWVSFTSDANNLAKGDTTGNEDVFVHDRLTGRTHLVSVGPSGGSAGGQSFTESAENMSDDGTRILFSHFGGGRLAEGLWVFDSETGLTSRVDNGLFPDAFPSAISGDGAVAAYYFYGRDSRIVGVVKVSLRDLNHPRYSVVATNTSAGTNAATVYTNVFVQKYIPTLSLSTSGRYVAFAADAADVVPGDTNAVADVFVRDTLRSSTVRISLTATAGQYTTASHYPVLSSDGRELLYYNNGSALLHHSTYPGAP